MEELKYRREDEMKDSGIEWLGKIPREWGVTKLKYKLNSFESGKRETFYKEEVLSIGGEHILNGKFNLKNPRYVSYKFYINSNQGKIKEGDILLVKDGATIGKTMFVDKLNFNTMVNEHVYRLEYSKYGYYVILSNSTQKQFWMKNNSTAQESINSNTLKNIDIVKNSIEEQQKIANFLDHKTSQFDSIISKKEKLIEKLEEAKKSLISEVVTGKVKIIDGEMVERKQEEMKDSGVEWLGMIPKDWEVKRLKYITDKVGSGKTPKGGSEVYVDKGILFLRSQNIQNEGLRLDDVVNIDKKTDREMSNTRVNYEDILLNITGASIGRATIFLNKDQLANVNQHVCIIRLRKNIKHKKFYLYSIQSNCIQNQIMSYQNGASREGLNFEQIKNLLFIVPLNIREKEVILGYLGRISSNINNIINKTKTQIQKLKEAKQSLISEAVTGKIDLRDWEIREVDDL